MVCLGLAVNFGPPPADADEEKAPVAEELRWLALEGVADELEDPSQDKQSERIEPEPMHEDAGDKNWDREQDSRDAQGMAGSVDGVLMAGGVLGDPLLVAPST